MSQMDIEQEIDYFSTLIDDCLIKIFDEITLDDLCAVSQTCKNLKRVAGNYFRRKHQDQKIPEILTINEFKGVIDFDWNHDYEYRFFRYRNVDEDFDLDLNPKLYSQFIEKIEIEFNSRTLIPCITKFIRENCAENVKLVRFKNRLPYRGISASRVKWLKSFAKANQKFLENVEIIEFDEVVSGFHKVLNYCKGIKYLQIINKKRRRITYPDRNYPAIKVLELKANFDCMDSNEWCRLGNFFQQNPNIKRFICKIQSFPSMPNNNTFEQLIKVLAANSSIEELFLSCTIRDGVEIDYELLFKEFKMLNDRDSFKRFEIKFKYNDDVTPNQIARFATLKKCTGLHLYNEFDHDDGEEGYLLLRLSLLQDNCFEHLKVLFLYNFILDTTFARQFVQNIPNLEEFYLECCPSTNRASEWFKLLSRSLQKLNKFSLNCSNFIRDYDYNNEIVILNAERAQLSDACKLFIYVRDWDAKDDCDPDKLIPYVTNDVINSLVQIKAVKLEKTRFPIERVNPLCKFTEKFGI